VKTRAIVAFAMAATAVAHAQEATYTVRLMTTETALRAAQAALQKCRDDGYQVAVAVVDRAGLAQALLRDRYAGAHTAKMAVDKAWTAVSFRTDTTALAEATEVGKPQSGIRYRPRVVAVGGGLIIESAGTLLGGIGVSGAPGGERDDLCARAGIAAIRDALDF
jgi:uncharacterized protein GlcG (DUF336 family)